MPTAAELPRHRPLPLVSKNLDGLLSRPAEARPVALEGRWLDAAPDECWAASDPVIVLEGAADSLRELPVWLNRHSQEYPEGAAIGFLSYELARHIEPLPLAAQQSLPDVSFAYYPRIERLRVGVTCAPSPLDAVRIDCGVNFKMYRRAVDRIRSYIAAGDIYQANLTIPFWAELGDEPPESVYLRMRSGGAPFRAFMKTPARIILSSSPERFIQVAGNHILTSPIKGTLARDGRDLARSEAALLASEKDRAENLMIVDLLRNDLGRICKYATIRARLWETEVLPQLVHLVSHVEGTLRPGVGILEILAALFPCGSITGAPKIRAMEILSEIEQTPRGVSMGAMGIIRGTPASGGCRMDFNVSIRTMVIEEGKASFNVGGGIVYDSDPVSEYAEVMLKAQPLFDALGAREAVVVSSKK